PMVSRCRAFASRSPPAASRLRKKAWSLSCIWSTESSPSLYAAPLVSRCSPSLSIARDQDEPSHHQKAPRDASYPCGVRGEATPAEMVENARADELPGYHKR